MAAARPSDDADRPRVVGVKRLADYLKRKLEGDAQLRGLTVRGEVSNASTSARGHFNFDLKEGDALLRCFAWADDAMRFPLVKNGAAVLASGQITTFAGKSAYQLVVREVALDGVGDVHAQFEERKKKLSAEGVFDTARKRPLPKFPFRVALVSSRGAAGAGDFVKLLGTRRPHVRIEWCETSVQGPNAASEIVGALARASRLDVDVIVLTRGGGSFEDLFVFSDENVVRAVARARHPVLSAVGHTVDQQLSDFAADLHAETPSAAAAMIGPETVEVRRRVADFASRALGAAELAAERVEGRLRKALVRSKLSDPRLFLLPRQQRVEALDAALGTALETGRRARVDRLHALAKRLDRFDPTVRLADRARDLTETARRLDRALDTALERAAARTLAAKARLDPAVLGRIDGRRHALALARAHLNGKDPEAILQRGYAIVTYEGGIVRDPEAVPIGAAIVARLARGTLAARVESGKTNGDERIG
jgi:exodeoxyribonuclease VII large subunit